MRRLALNLTRVAQFNLGGVLPPAVERTADLSECTRYRYALRMVWGTGPLLVWILLNPSTADALVDDPTSRKCRKFAMTWGFGRLTMLNLFAWRSTSPNLDGVEDPVGPRNCSVLWDHIAKPQPLGTTIVLGWGNGGACAPLEENVVEELRFHGTPAYCLGKNRNGTPKHPLYIRDDAALQVFT